jgi:O-antigen/teichoic acid export membrane protein
LKILQSAAIYTAASLFEKSISFMLLPILTHFLTVQDYGTITLFTTYYSFLVPIISLQLPVFASVEYFKTTDRHEFASRITSGLIHSFLISVGLLAGSYLFLPYLEKWLGIPTSWIQILPVLAFVASFHMVLTAFYEVRKQVIPYIILYFSLSFVNLGLSLYLVTQANMGMEGRFLSLCVTNLLFGIVAFGLLWKEGFIVKPKPIIRYRTVFLPMTGLAMNAIGTWAMNMSDRIFITQIEGNDALGIYTVGYTIGIVVYFLQSALTSAFNPFQFSRLQSGTDDAKKELVIGSYLFIAVLCVAGLGLVLIAPFIFKYLLHPRYAEGIAVVKWIVLAYICLGLHRIQYNYLTFLEKSNILGGLAIINIIVNVLLNFVLISYFGYIGGAYATMLTFLLFAIILCGICYHYYPLPWFEFTKLYAYIQNYYKNHYKKPL